MFSRSLDPQRTFVCVKSNASPCPTTGHCPEVSETGDKAAAELAFTEAAHVVRLEATINRVTGVPMELRAAVGAYGCGRHAVHAVYLGRRWGSSAA